MPARSERLRRHRRSRRKRCNSRKRSLVSLEVSGAGALPPWAGGAPRQAPADAASIWARAAAMRCAAGEAGPPGIAPAQWPPAGPAVPEAAAPPLAPPAHSRRPPHLASWPEEEGESTSDDCQDDEGFSRSSSTSSTTAASESFSLTLRRVDAAMPFGLEVRPDASMGYLVVSSVRPGGVCEAWNRQNLGELRELRKRDRITSVNDVRDAASMREEFHRRLTVRLQVERGDVGKGMGDSSSADSIGYSISGLSEAACSDSPAQPAPPCGQEEPASIAAAGGPPGEAKPALRHGRTRGARGRRGRGGKA
uniref:PDZ domain-containing protein n=1 Tax=Alexandrium catenella TaxID=2925 RepID=A0A7S1RML3_ALECA